MKEVIFYLFTNIVFYQINFINKYCVVYTKYKITKLDIKFLIKYIFKLNYNHIKNRIKINMIKKYKFCNKYIILF